MTKIKQIYNETESGDYENMEYLPRFRQADSSSNQRTQSKPLLSFPNYPNTIMLFPPKNYKNFLMSVKLYNKDW